MIDKKIIDYVQECEKNTFDAIDKALDKRFKSLSELIAYENQDVKERINDLKKQVAIQNGSVRELKEWRAKQEGKEAGKSNYIKSIIQAGGFLIAIIMMLIGYKSLQETTRELDNKIEYMIPINTRGDYYNPFEIETETDSI